MSRRLLIGQNQDMKKRNASFEKGETVLKYLGRTRSKFYSGRNWEQTEVRECLLSFGAESFVFQFAIQNI